MRNWLCWFHWRSEINRSPVRKRCWRAVKKHKVYKKFARARWYVVVVKEIKVEEVLGWMGPPGQDQTIEEFRRALEGSTDLCEFLIANRDLSGLEQRGPSLVGRGYAVYVDAATQEVLWWEERQRLE